MDIVSTSIYLLLYIFLLIFVFSIGILSPYLSKKDIGGIIIIGLIIGAVGGLFFISPIYEDLAEVVGTGYSIFSNEDELINVDISSNSGHNVSEVIKTASSLNNVHNVSTANITVETGNFSNTWDQYIIVGIKHNIDHSENVGNVVVDNTNGILYINLTGNPDPSIVVEEVSAFLRDSYDLPTLSSLVRVQVHVSPNDVDNVKEQLHEKGYPTTDVEGPIENIVQSTKNDLSLGHITLITGIIGMVFAILGICVDKVYNTWKRRDNNKRQNELSIKQIKAERRRQQKQAKEEAKLRASQNQNNGKSSNMPESNPSRFNQNFKAIKSNDAKSNELRKLKEKSKIEDSNINEGDLEDKK